MLLHSHYVLLKNRDELRPAGGWLTANLYYGYGVGLYILLKTGSWDNAIREF